MTTVNTDQAREVFEAAGLKGTALDQALQGIVNMRTTASIEVGINSGDDVKFGDVSVYKVQPNGYRRTAMGVRTSQIPGFLVNLADALEQVDPQAHAEWIASLSS